MEYPLWAMLDPLVGNPDEYCQSEILLKKIDRDYLDRTFTDMLQKLLDPEADEYNPAYNRDERTIANLIQHWVDRIDGSTSMPQVRISARPNNGDESPILINLEDRVSDYAGRILRTENFPNEENTTFQIIELYIRPYCLHSF